MNILHLIGAYGRHYSNWAEMKADWDNGLDFKICNGPCTSKLDMPTYKAMNISILVFMFGKEYNLTKIYRIGKEDD